MKLGCTMQRLVRGLEKELGVVVEWVRSENRGYWHSDGSGVIRWRAQLKDGRMFESEDSATACIRAVYLSLRKPPHYSSCWQIDAETKRLK